MTIYPATEFMRRTVAVRSFIICFCCSGMTFAQTPADWKTTHDMNGACQISFPSSWKVNEPPDGWAKAPEGTEAGVLAGSANKLQPLTTSDIKLYQVDRLLENTSQRVFYVTKPRNGRVTYILDVQGKKTRCTAQIVVNTGHPEDEIKRIAATITEMH